jgi:hypothetical protein
MLRSRSLSLQDLQDPACNSRISSDSAVSPYMSSTSLAQLTFPVSSGLLFLTDTIIGRSSAFSYIRQKHNLVQAWEAPSFGNNGSITSAEDISRNVTPLKCHSHNDYWRRVPLYQALHYGCASVEADIWLTDNRDDSELYVGHSMASLKQNHTLQSTYINPLLELLDATNQNNTSNQTKGVFDTAPSQPLVLLIDIKNKPGLSFDALSKHLEPLRARNYLTYHNGTALVPGPITIVTTGSTPYTSILTQPPTKRDIFFDAPLGALTPPIPISLSGEISPSSSIENNQDTPQSFQDYNTTTSLYASASLRHVLGSPLPFLFPWAPTSRQLQRIRSASRAAHARGLQVRWWDTPAWPRSQSWLWGFLEGEGADVLNVDDLEGVSGWGGW